MSSIFDTDPIYTSCADACAHLLVGPGRSAITAVPTAAQSRELLAANSGRMGFAVKNESEQTLFLALADRASRTRYTIDLQPGASYLDSTNWTGAVSGILAAGTGIAVITELFS